MTAFDIEGLADLFERLHSLPPSSGKREYWRGRIDEHIAQNAVSDSDVALARAQGLARSPRRAARFVVTAHEAATAIRSAIGCCDKDNLVAEAEDALDSLLAESDAKEMMRHALVTRTAELDQAREALREIVSRFPRGCGVIHGNHPQGWTCLDIVEDAEEHPEKYSVSHRARILGGSYICEACVARAALTGGPQPRSALDARYHVPRSQVWKGSRGRQHGLVHLHVAEPFDLGRIHREPGEALCGRRGWYERPAGGEALCPRCEAIRDRTGRA